MGQFIAFGFIIYIIVASGLLPLILVDSYLKARDCRAAHGVDVCTIIYVPATEATP